MTQQELDRRIREAELIRSSRRTISLEIRADGGLRIRAPYRMPKMEIQRFVRKNRNWIARKMEQADRRAQEKGELVPFTEEELQLLTEQARRELPQRAAEFAWQMGVTYGRITIRHQKTRWGSCSSKGNLNFNCLLMLTPREVQDYVLVHELAHRAEMNHSPRFWALVEKILPDYREQRKWLRTEGRRLIERLP